MKEKIRKRPLKRSVIVGSVLFITVLCILLGITTYCEYRKALYSRYEAYITDLLNYVGSNIDVDDLKDCLDKGEKSEKYNELQAFIDNVKDTHNIDFLYVIIPIHPGERDNIMNVIAAMSEYEKEFEPENEVQLGELTGDSYPAETAEKYYNALSADGVVFFEEVAEWGDDYTGILLLRTSDGSVFAELCVDLPVQEIHDTIKGHMMISISLILALGVLFMSGFVIWITRSVADPIARLEKSVVSFASREHGTKLSMNDPDIHTHNEIESLSRSVMKMADDINNYVNEVIEAERAVTEISELVSKDQITGIRNRLAFTSYMQDLQERLDRGDKIEFAVGVFDCDDVLGINERYGHERGDDYLRSASRLICKVFKRSHVFRIGGDEFVVILRGDDLTDRAELHDRFYSESDRINAEAENEWDQVHAAVGIAGFNPQIDKTVSDTVRRAEKIMYDGKRSRKEPDEDRQHSYFVDSDDAYWKEQYIIDNFKTALDQRWIKVYYQPVMRIESGKLSSLEALARWIDPVRGMMTPNEFVYVLSRYHRMYMLDLYMLEEVCREFGVRGEAGLPLAPVSVNFSAQDFDCEDIPARIKEITDKYGLTPDDIIIEITEQDVAEGTERFKDALKQIRDCGYKLWIDDFGSGYSSLNVISRYDIDRIKFDMDLVRRLDENNGANRKILDAMVKVCRDLGINTLAEGVETEAQLEFLRTIGCDMAQGYYFFKPEPVDVSIYKFNHRSADIPHEIDDKRPAAGRGPENPQPPASKPLA